MSYDVVGVLGRGGSAVVELAVDGDGRLVATKRVAVTGSAAQMHVARRRLLREAEILRRLAHPGIVPILDVVDDGADVILVFPAMRESLEDRVGRLGPLPPGEVIRIGGVLLAGLATAHRHGVVHRDIKPANVLFDEAGRPALSDFGVAVTREITGGLTPPDYAVGTPRWMAPEQARGEPAGPSSDVFSLAATLHYAATGQVPSVEPRGVVTGDLPAGLRRPLERMLDPRPERRPSAAAVLGGLEGTTVTPMLTGGSGQASVRSGVSVRPERAGALGAAAVAGRTLARVVSRLLGSPSDRPERPRRRRLAVGAALAAVVAAAGVVALVGFGPSGRPAVPPLHTVGKACAPGWYNLDGTPGCESRPDYVAGIALTQGAAVHANLVPLSATDSFTTHVKGSAGNFCWGSLRVTLTAPASTAEQLSIWKGTRKVADAVSTNGTPATATVDKPSCFGADSEDLQISVTAVAATGAASANDFTLTRNGGW